MLWEYTYIDIEAWIFSNWNFNLFSKMKREFAKAKFGALRQMEARRQRREAKAFSPPRDQLQQVFTDL